MLEAALAGPPAVAEGQDASAVAAAPDEEEGPFFLPPFDDAGPAGLPGGVGGPFITPPGGGPGTPPVTPPLTPLTPPPDTPVSVGPPISPPVGPPFQPPGPPPPLVVVPPGTPGLRRRA